MEGPHRACVIGTSRILLVGTIAGFVPDAARIQEAFRSHAPTALALGVPKEDLAALEALWSAPQDDAASNLAAAPPLDMGPIDLHTEKLFSLLKPWGECRTPSPDLETAYDLAKTTGIPVVAVDLDDQAHAELFTQRVGMRHVMRSNSVHARMLKKPFPQHAGPYALATAWDAELNSVGPFADVERIREEEMAARIAELAAKHERILAILAVPRLEGVAKLLGSLR